jgi:hypothetical protein
MKINVQWWKGRKLSPFFLNSKSTYWRVVRIGRFVMHFDSRPRLIPIEEIK